MTTHGSIARRVREAKEKYPTEFCSAKGCLFRIVTNRGVKVCPRHSVAASESDTLLDEVLERRPVERGATWENAT